MKNKEITMLGLANRIYNRIAPKKIKYDGDVWEYCEDDCNYYSKNQDVMLNNEYISILKFLDDKVEILPEENDEWEDIGIIENIDNFTIGDLIELNAKTINQLIKNQKYLKEKLESKNEDL